MNMLTRILVVLLLWATAVTLQGQSTSNNLSLPKTTEIPGSTLRAGSYNLSVLDSLNDRIVMQVNSADGKSQTLLLGVPASLSGTPGQPVFWDAKEKGKHALRGFVFADGKSVEFVYPKADAVTLAKTNHSSVVAVDPASEGRPELGRLSSRDMQMVSLWLLTPTRVSGQEALEAKHFVPNGSIAPQQAANVPASVQDTGTDARYSNASAANTNQYTGKPAQQSLKHLPTSSKAGNPVPTKQTLRASNNAPAGLHRLPQTGSTLPLWFLMTATCLTGAAALRMRRSIQENV